MNDVVRIDAYRRERLRARRGADAPASRHSKQVALRQPSFSADDLRLTIGTGWHIENAERLAEIVGGNALLRRCLTDSADLIATAFAEPCVLKIAPSERGDAVEIEFETDIDADRWMAGRHRVMAAWLHALPPQCCEDIVL